MQDTNVLLFRKATPRGFGSFLPSGILHERRQSSRCPRGGSNLNLFIFCRPGVLGAGLDGSVVAGERRQAPQGPCQVPRPTQDTQPALWFLFRVLDPPRLPPAQQDKVPGWD